MGEYFNYDSNGNLISRAVVRKDHDAKITGAEKFTDDLRYAEDGREFLIGRLVRTNIARGEIISVVPPELPKGYYYIDAKDAPVNISYYPLNADASMSDEDKKRLENSTSPLFADKFSEYAGEPVALIVGPDAETVKQLAESCRIEYRELPAVIHLSDAQECFAKFNRSWGCCKEAFAQADFVYEETFTTERQYQAYLEPQSIIAEPCSGGQYDVFVHGALQCPYSVQDSVSYSLNCAPQKVRVRQEPTGGGFGGKEDFPSVIAAQAAVAAVVTKQPVKIILDRREDLQFTFKRHPSITTVRAAVKDGMVTAMDISGKMDVGAFLGSSMDVVDRYFSTFPGVFSLQNLNVHAEAMKTNTPPNGAFRGFGVPQAMFVMDMLMSHIADKLGVDELSFKKKHFARKGSMSYSGAKYPFEVPLPKMLDMAEAATGYSKKRAMYNADCGGTLRPGIGIAFANHGAPLKGNIEWGIVKPRVKLIKHSDGSVDIYTSQTEMGQGVRTAFSKIAAETLNIPYDRVNAYYPDTDSAFATGITAASRSVVCVGKAVEEAALLLKNQWADGKEQQVEHQYRKPAHIDDVCFNENQYHSDSWSVVVVEVLVDILTGHVRITNAHGVYNVGTPIDENVIRGQMEGGFLQALGYASTERLVFGENGKIFNTAFADYHIPSAVDLPKVSVEFERSEYQDGPFGAKGAGELPMDAGAAAYIKAVEQALRGIRDVNINKIPFGAEDVINVIHGRKDNV